MSEHIADNHEALLDYLYEEGDPAVRLAVGRHLQECAPCSVAVLEFQNVRGMLRDWTPPAADLGFRIVQERDRRVVPAPAQAGWSARFPGLGYGGWARAAAAVLLFVAGMAVSQLTMSYSDGALTVRVLPAGDPVAPISRPGRDIPLPAAVPTPTTVAAEQASDSRQPTGGSDLSTEQLLQRVRAMIDQSEQRQQRELARRLLEVATEVDTQHQADLLKIQQNIGQQQDEMMNYLVRTSGGAR